MVSFGGTLMKFDRSERSAMRCFSNWMKAEAAKLFEERLATYTDPNGSLITSGGATIRASLTTNGTSLDPSCH